MGIHVIKMPDIGEGIAEVELVGWHVKPGDDVREDQLLADVMTDKATVEIPSPVAGRVIELGGEVGEQMAVGAELIRIETESAATVPAPTAAATPKPAATAPVMAARAPAAAQSTAPAVAAARTAPAPAPKLALAPASTASLHRLHQSGERPLASPSVRRHARELGIELREVPGSGPAGRIMHEDLAAYARSQAARSGTAAAAGNEAGGLPDTLRYARRDDETAVPMVGLRRRIAQKMQESKRHIPHYSYVEELEVDALEALRAQFNARWGVERGHLTLLPFLVRAIVLAVREYPQVNARFDDEAGVVTQYGAVHVGIATQTDAGLMVPVLRHAETLDLWSCAAGIARLAEAARSASATRDELSGSTITITSLGPLGGIASTPVINHPEVAIVGVNRIVERPVIRNGAMVARRMMNLSSSFDHRVVDGQRAAEFVQAIRLRLECPAMLFVD